MKFKVSLENRSYIIKSLQDLYSTEDKEFEVYIVNYEDIVIDAKYFDLKLNDPVVTKRFNIYYRTNVFFKNTIMVYACPTKRYLPFFVMGE